MLKQFVALLLCLACLLSLVGCSTPREEQNQPYALSFTDATGYELHLSARPQKVAVLFSSFADIWVIAGGTVDITVGESVERGFAASDVVLVDADSGHNEIDLETLLSAEPDLVIGTADYEGQVQACRFCRENGVPAALFRVETVDDYLGVLDIFCRLTGQGERYERYGTAVKAQVDELLASVAAHDEGTPKILFVRAGSSAKSTKAKTAADHFACAMLTELGCDNIADRAPVLLDGLSLEQIVAQDPQYIFISVMGDEYAARSYISGVFAQDGWRDLTAVRENRYIFLPKDLFQYKPNARWAQAYEYLIELLYPGVIGEN